MSALLSAMASSRSSCSCRRSRASLSCSAFSLSRLAQASCCSSLPNCKGKWRLGYWAQELQPAAWGGARAWARLARAVRAQGNAMLGCTGRGVARGGRLPGVHVKNQKTPEARVLVGSGEGTRTAQS